MQIKQFFTWDPTEKIATRPLVWSDGTDTRYYTHDANKNVSEVVAADGTIAAHYEYAPFGALTAERGESAAANPWRFSGEYADDETGTMYYNYRQYEPVTGRWMQRDRIGEYGGLNVYAFVGNEILFKIDRIGLITNAQLQGILEKLMACKESDDGLNWDAAIETLYEQAFGKSWRQKIQNVLKKGAELAGKIVDYGDIPPGAYQDVKEFLDWAYPDGAPAGLLEKLQSLPPVDYKRYVEGWNKTMGIASIASILISDEPITIDSYADFMDSWLGLSGFGDSLGGPIFMAYYNTLMEGIKEGLKNIIKQTTEKEYELFINQDCCNLTRGIYYGNIIGPIRSALLKPKEVKKEMK